MVECRTVPSRAGKARRSQKEIRMKVAKLLAMAAVLGLAGSAFAQGRGGDPNLRPLMGQVVKVEEGKITVKPTFVRPGTDANTATVVVTTDAKTVVTIDDKEAKVADLKADLYVTVTPRTGTATKIVATKEAPPRRGGASRPAAGAGA
jgi:hypothetical protein